MGPMKPKLGIFVPLENMVEKWSVDVAGTLPHQQTRHKILNFFQKINNNSNNFIFFNFLGGSLYCSQHGK